jgi:hypothetical protein
MTASPQVPWAPGANPRSARRCSESGRTKILEERRRRMDVRLHMRAHTQSFPL